MVSSPLSPSSQRSLGPHPHTEEEMSLDFSQTSSLWVHLPSQGLGLPCSWQLPGANPKGQRHRNPAHQPGRPGHAGWGSLLPSVHCGPPGAGQYLSECVEAAWAGAVWALSAGRGPGHSPSSPFTQRALCQAVLPDSRPPSCGPLCPSGRVPELSRDKARWADPPGLQSGATGSRTSGGALCTATA